MCVCMCVCEAGVGGGLGGLCYTAFSSVGVSALRGSRRVCWTAEVKDSVSFYTRHTERFLNDSKSNKNSMFNKMKGAPSLKMVSSSPSGPGAVKFSELLVAVQKIREKDLLALRDMMEK